MYEYRFPFDNAAIDNIDRNASSDEFAEYLEAITGMSHGVYPNPSTGLDVTAKTGLSLNIGAGFCIIKGRIRRLVKDVEVTLEAGEGLDRIDRVVMRLDKSKRSINLTILKGTATVSPVPKELTRDGDIYEIALADIRVSKMSANINQWQITDLRANTELCGYMPVFGSFDTTSLFNQYQSALDHYLELVGSALDETTAGYLQGQIDDNRTVLTSHSEELSLYVRPLKENKTYSFDLSTNEDWKNACSEISKLPRCVQSEITFRFNILTTWEEVVDQTSIGFVLDIPFYGGGTIIYKFIVPSSHNTALISICDHKCKTVIRCVEDSWEDASNIQYWGEATFRVFDCDNLFIQSSFAPLAIQQIPLLARRSHIYIGGFTGHYMDTYRMPFLSSSDKNFSVKVRPVLGIYGTDDYINNTDTGFITASSSVIEFTGTLTYKGLNTEFSAFAAALYNSDVKIETPTNIPIPCGNFMTNSTIRLNDAVITSI